MARVFYGWKIVAVAFLTHCVTVGLVFYSFGVFLPALAAHFGWSRAEVSFGFSLLALCAAVYAPFVGRVVDRFGPRPSQLVGGFALALGFFLLSRVNSLRDFYLLMGLLVSLGGAALGQLPSTAAVTSWFVRRRGRALGISTTGISMGGVIFVPLTQILIDRYGWRDAFALLGALIAALVIPPVALFMRRSPESMGLAPDGDAVAAAAETHAPMQEIEPSWTPAQAVRHRNFWLIVVAFTLTVTGLSATLLHQMTFLGDRGIAAARASWVLGGTAALGVLGKLGFGALLDRYEHRRVIIACFLMQCFGLLFLMLPPSAPTLALYVVVYGFSMGGTATLQATIVGVCFGRLHYGGISGRIAPFMVVTQAVFVPLAGWVRDTVGTYDPAFAAIIIANLVAGACIGELDVEARPAPPA